MHGPSASVVWQLSLRVHVKPAADVLNSCAQTMTDVITAGVSG